MEQGSQNYICSIYRSIPTPVLALDVSKKELLFSSGLAEKILGYSSEEFDHMAHEDFAAIIHPDDLSTKDETRLFLEKSKDGEVIKSTKRVKAANGKYFHFQMYDSVYERDEEGAIKKITIVALDITPEVEAKKNLEKAIKIIEKIKYKNSHDLRGPVASIIGILSLIDPTTLQNPEEKLLFEQLGKSAKKLDDIIHQINDEPGV